MVPRAACSPYSASSLLIGRGPWSDCADGLSSIEGSGKNSGATAVTSGSRAVISEGWPATIVGLFSSETKNRCDCRGVRRPSCWLALSVGLLPRVQGSHRGSRHCLTGSLAPAASCSLLGLLGIETWSQSFACGAPL